MPEDNMVIVLLYRCGVTVVATCGSSNAEKAVNKRLIESEMIV
jgi:hypothetical protein